MASSVTFGMKCFNPCRVFSGLATVPDGLHHRRGVEVSIPVGFFQALQPPGDAGGLRAINGFNPCRVFSGLATEVVG